MKRLALFLAVLFAFAVAAAPAFAHVHRTVPLGECTVDDPNSGASNTDHEGFIPFSVGAGENGNIPEGPADDEVQCP
jgi:hypothetical protein